MDIVPGDGHWAEVTGCQSMLILPQLSNESHPDLEVGPTGIQKLQSLNHRPVILAHNVAGQDARGATLASH